MMSHEDRVTRIASSSSKVASDQLLPGWAVLSQGRGLSRGSAQEQSPGRHWLCSSVVSSHIATQRRAQRDVCQEA